MDPDPAAGAADAVADADMVGMISVTEELSVTMLQDEALRSSSVCVTVRPEHYCVLSPCALLVCR